MDHRRHQEDNDDETSDMEELPAHLATPFVISASRREDVWASESRFEQFVDSLREKKFVYPRTLFAKKGEMCQVSTSKTALVQAWSKDFRLLVTNWTSHVALFEQFKWIFTFTINNERGCMLEPGMRSTLDERMDQLARLVDICGTRLRQNPALSIMVHVDPIMIWSERVSFPAEDDPTRILESVVIRNNTGHIPQLVATMKRLGLNRLHISFYQEFRTVGPRARANIEYYNIRMLSDAERRDLLDRCVFPYTGPAGISVETCTDLSIVRSYIEKPSPLGPIFNCVQGACVGKDMATAACPELRFPVPKNKQRPDCQCVKFTDIGIKSDDAPCGHGCRYCFMKPKFFPIQATSISRAQYLQICRDPATILKF